MAPLAPIAVAAMSLGPQSPEIFGGLESAPALLDEDKGTAETGYALGSDGSIRVHVLTPMAGVTAEMWDWWFGWHGSDPRRYKLWHPQAHMYAEWADGDDGDRRGRERYVGRTSFIDEYLGSTLLRGAIRFVPPGELGLDETRLVAGRGETAVCARVGSSRMPVDAGYLVHHVRRADRGRSAGWRGSVRCGSRPAVASRHAPDCSDGGGSPRPLRPRDGSPHIFLARVVRRVRRFLRPTQWRAVRRRRHRWRRSSANGCGSA
jgi:hypothetical protein